ncbi:acyl-CoA dehydrogenase family protein [Pseudomonas sp. SDO528_S397]
MTHAVDTLLTDIQALAPELAARSAEIEDGRRIPLDLIEKLKAIGVFRLFVPKRLGGLELDFPSGMRVVTALAKIDASVGWSAMISTASTMMAALVQEPVLQRVYGAHPNAIIAGAGSPGGMAEEAEGGYRVTGRWPFASGCQQADWMIGFCLVTRDGKPVPSDSGSMLTKGMPKIRGIILPATEWQIEDTWHVMGLKGTGSHHISLADTFVPEENCFDIDTSSASSRGPLYSALLELIPLSFGAFFLGVAQGALEDVITLANSGRVQQRTMVPMRDSEQFQAEIGRIQAELQAAQAYQTVQVDHHWQQALAGTLRSDAFTVQAQQQTVWVATTCCAIVDACFALAGGAVVYEHASLQRRLRDARTGAQHFSTQQRHYATTGKYLLDSARPAETA